MSPVTVELDLNGLCDGNSVESPFGSDSLLKLHHLLLVASGIGRVTLERPAEKEVGVVGLKVGVGDTETLAIVGDLGLECRSS